VRGALRRLHTLSSLGLDDALHLHRGDTLCLRLCRGDTLCLCRGDALRLRLCRGTRSAFAARSSASRSASAAASTSILSPSRSSHVVVPAATDTSKTYLLSQTLLLLFLL
jgi:hypothetical protein